LLVDGLLPAVRYATQPTPDAEIAVGSSKIGGDPDLAAGVEWPFWLGPDGGKTRRPLRFFAQLNLEHAWSAAPGELGLPSTGLLSFFADFTDDGITGILGLYDDEQEGCRVLYSAPGASLERRRSTLPVLQPAALYPLGAWTWLQDVEADDYDAFEAWETEYENRLREQCPPGWDLGGRHQLGGHARYIQHPVEEEVVQAVSGCFKRGRGGAFDHDRWLEVEDQVKDWRVLLQIDSDQTLDLIWGDVGTLWWAAPSADAARGDWSRAMFNFQCA
jgi:uncharacterized protein YwqG